MSSDPGVTQEGREAGGQNDVSRSCMVATVSSYSYLITLTLKLLLRQATIFLQHFRKLSLYLLALSFQIFAVKAVVETPSIVTLKVTHSVVEVAPTLQRGGAVLPRVVEVQRTVAVVPAALVVVAHLVAAVVVLVRLALRDQTFHLQVWGGRDVVAKPSLEAVVQDVAAEAVEVGGADAVVEWCLGGVLAGAAVVAGV